MSRNCNLELGLFPPYDGSGGDHHHNQLEEEDKQQHQITIFYDGKICVSDVTELQAKSILMLANKKVEEKASSTTRTRIVPSESSKASSLSSLPPTTITTTIVQSNNNNNNNNSNELYGTGTGLSMKKSLQRFLQKRKIRIQEASPYNHH